VASLGNTLAKQKKQAVLRMLTEELLAGEKNISKLAAKHDVTRRTIYNYIRKIQKNKKAPLEPLSDADFKATLKPKAVKAVEAGLDCTEDSYKRGALGIQFLKGTGDLQPDGMVGINVLMKNIPSDLRAEFKALPDSSE
jgi:transposase-like protein